MNDSHALNLITALWLGGVGACIGSFLNVVAYRLPLGMSVIWKPSHCPKCGHAIRARDNVPVFGWLWLNGRCRDCGERISPRYAIVELIMGLAFFVLAYIELFCGGANLPQGPISEFSGAVQTVWEPQWLLIGIYAYHTLLLSLLMCVVLIDLDNQKVPCKLVGFGLVVGAGLAVLYPMLQPNLPLLAGKGLASFKGLLGAGLGLFVGNVSAKFVSSGQEKTGSRNRTIGFIMVGAFLGWQGVFSMLVVVLISGLGTVLLRLANHWFGRALIWPVVLVQILFWEEIARAVFPR